MSANAASEFLRLLCGHQRVETPLAIYNRPGLPAIAYRVGNYASVRKSLLARLSDSDWPVLRQLRTRDNDDFTIALLDAWAVTSDVLTFYQERIANESYLRTATERLSILEQSRLLGYQLAPGLAASTYLAFTMERIARCAGTIAKPVQLGDRHPCAKRARSGRAAAEFRNHRSHRSAGRVERDLAATD